VRAEWLVLLPDVYEELAASCSNLGPGNDYEPATCSSDGPANDELSLDALLKKAVGGPVRRGRCLGRDRGQLGYGSSTDS